MSGLELLVVTSAAALFVISCWHFTRSLSRDLTQPSEQKVLARVHRTTALLALATIVSAPIVLIALSWAVGDSSYPIAGQVVTPHFGGPAGGSTSGERVHLSLYEYDKRFHDYTITGQSISFEIPKNVLQSTDNLSGGPQALINLRLDPRRNGDRSSRVNVILVTSAISPMGGDDTDILERGHYPRMPGLSGGPRLRSMGKDYCGLRAYERGEPEGRFDHKWRDQAQRNVTWLFSDAVVLLGTTAGNPFPVIACAGDVKSDGFAYCGLNTTYRGWPMHLNFSASYVCKIPDLLRHVSRALDGYRVRETQRASGVAEYRYRGFRVEF